MTHAASAPAPDAEHEAPPFPPAAVEELLRTIVKAIRATQMYLPNNPMYSRAVEQVQAGFAGVWQKTDELRLVTTETDLRWFNQPVLVEPQKSADSLPWLLFKDGVRELIFRPGFEETELGGLFEIIQRVRKASPDEDDLITLLWEKDFACLRYRFVDLALESAQPLGELMPAEMSPGAVTREAVQAVEDSTSRAGIVRLDDFDSTLYFLDEREITYLQNEVTREYASDLRRNVIAILLDIFEQQTDPTVRDEICGILDLFVLHLLSAGQFTAVAYLLRESAVAIERARDLVPGHRQRIVTLPERLSAPEALTQLLESLDEAAQLPPQEELTELFEQLRPLALGTAFTWLGRLQNPHLRVLLETSTARLASANTGELIRLIGSQQEAVAVEAIRRAGALRTSSAVAPLGKVLSDGNATMRLLAVQALGEIGSAGALQVLERGIDDSDRDVRVTAARVVAARQYRQALPRVKAVIEGKAVREADLTEKMAIFEAFGALSGDGGVDVLDSLLNAKGFLGRREDPELRACAAMALGRIGTERAIESLRRASSEKEVLVRNAVNRALRGTA
ncbi:MAG TPA: HEAT repeat domain-containing protein [Gemmatimonadaceae bacterium]|nr:HEAT repeat domain-containing protein [Gemmatimonadaceae bacterium]